MRFLPALTLSALAASVIAAPILAQERDRPSRECRAEVVQLCGSDRSEIRSCLIENADSLSSECSAEIRALAQQRRGERGERGQRRGGGNREERRGGERRGSQTAGMKVDATIFYGAHSRQTVDYFAAKGEPQADLSGNPPPLVLFIHGGGWKFGDHKVSVVNKPKHFTESGYAFASTGYRLLPDAPVEEQARDIGLAIAVLRGQADALGFDPDRIVLMGHSAGAHLAALVSTDPQYAGDSFDAIQGVIPLDGAGYDIARNMASASGRAALLYADVFGDDPARQAALSPITHVGGPDAPHWLILYVAGRERSGDQSRLLAESLTSAGADAQTVAVPDTDHRQLNQNLGLSGDAATEQVDAFLARVFAD